LLIIFEPLFAKGNSLAGPQSGYITRKKAALLWAAFFASLSQPPHVRRAFSAISTGRALSLMKPAAVRQVLLEIAHQNPADL
jgi:hypothetical protein